ncbi:hypothetical protein D3C80_1645770 [compost metagenome]
MVVLVAHFRLLFQPVHDRKNAVAGIGRCGRQLGQAFGQVDAGARGVQGQEDHDRLLLVDIQQMGDDIDQQAFGIGPDIVEAADKQKHLVYRCHRKSPLHATDGTLPSPTKTILKEIIQPSRWREIAGEIPKPAVESCLAPRSSAVSPLRLRFP